MSEIPLYQHAGARRGPGEVQSVKCLWAAVERLRVRVYLGRRLGDEVIVVHPPMIGSPPDY